MSRLWIRCLLGLAALATIVSCGDKHDAATPRDPQPVYDDPAAAGAGPTDTDPGSTITLHCSFHQPSDGSTLGAPANRLTFSAQGCDIDGYAHVELVNSGNDPGLFMLPPNATELTVSGEVAPADQTTDNTTLTLLVRPADLSFG